MWSQLLHGAEEIERQYKATQKGLLRRKLPRKELWQQLLADEKYSLLAECFEKLGWTRQDAPGEIFKLYGLLSRHVHMEFQLSTLQFDIVEGVVDNKQAQALACISRQLNLDWRIVSAMPADSTSGGSEQDE